MVVISLWDRLQLISGVNAFSNKCFEFITKYEVPVVSDNCIVIVSVFQVMFANTEFTFGKRSLETDD